MIHPNAAAKWCEQYQMASKTGDVGVELEIEGSHLPTGDIESWVVKNEGSLRGEGGRAVPPGSIDSPYEYVLARPSTYKNLEKKLQKLQSALTDPKVTVRLSDRGSTHIHINMLNNTVREIIGFLIIFTTIEPVLLRICGPNRNGNLFCLPSYEAGNWAETVSRMTKSVLNNSVRGDWPVRRGKYAALNTDPLVVFGTLEARCFPNCIDAAEINKWAGWMMNIRTLASEWEDETYLSLVDKACNEPRWLLRRVFSDEPLNGPCFPDPPETLVQFGVEIGYEIAKAAYPMLAWDGKTTKRDKYEDRFLPRWATADDDVEWRRRERDEMILDDEQH